MVVCLTCSGIAVCCSDLLFRFSRWRRMKTSDQEEQPAVFQREWLKQAPYQLMKVGAAIDFDLLEYNEDARTACLRVASRDVGKLWSSLTLLGFYQNQPCAFRVLQVSPDLLYKSPQQC
ncbi:ribonuclease P protein subunit p14 isoform X2 [Synchiropus splendidus]|uniref:ribonuclease P protein subunit p14 isoform X2 n=2 Tax=Synchiropus splendidus TaxID=270530 RepID=UPI00237E0927|nr:ribonuclease P protein subunit p14 isoform X2 [Synchiropus splendidus]